jgi:hypothetical protein
VRRPNIARARERLGWEPRVTLEEGLTDMIAFERTNKSHATLDDAGEHDPPALGRAQDHPNRVTAAGTGPDGDHHAPAECGRS